MDTIKMLQQCLHHHILTTGFFKIQEKHSGDQDQLPYHIDVWYASYSVLDQNFLFLSTLISPEEKQKAAGFKKSDDARRYILRQGMVRFILGQYIHEDPEKMQIVRTKSGKPSLDPEGKFSDVRFSISHTDAMVCLGITRNQEIGLDIVKTNPRTPISDVEQYLFTPGERKWIEQTIPEQRFMQFFRIWSLKEALLKATGSDVSIMSQADVSGIITKKVLNGFYTIQLGEKDFQFFICENACDEDHHCVIVSYRN
jgi:4'-phosphopantetheinyl transferase